MNYPEAESHWGIKPHYQNKLVVQEMFIMVTYYNRTKFILVIQF